MAGETSEDFERYKYRIDLIKWVITSVVLVIVTIIIDWGFKDRSAGLQEIQQYDKYVTDLIVLNKEVGPRRLLAQYFSIVTPSTKLRDRWAIYFKEMDAEYQQLANEKASLAKQVSQLDSSKSDTAGGATSVYKNNLVQQIMQIDKQLTTDVRTIPQNTRIDYEAAREFELEGFDYLMQKDVSKAIDAFANAENNYPSFHQVYEIRNFLSSNRVKLNSQDEQEWKAAYKVIADKFGWEMPEDIKAAFRKK
ncbi:MAG: hypothetical protein JWN76_3801 [Chitinophagaceae bacterium]|nr:hypothetical protein [Chitinophagaceae bacterium]